jgi:ABC-type amino acid transport substrate-binding protein
MTHRNTPDKPAAKATGRRVAKRPMTPLDWFGLACLLLMAVCSLILLAQLLSTGMLTAILVFALIGGLVFINIIHAIIQIPRWRNKLPKLIGGIVALLITAVMIYGITAADALRTALVNVSGQMVEKEITYVVVRNDNPAQVIGDTAGYSFGILSNADEENTTTVLEAVKDGLGKISTKSYDSIPLLAEALMEKDVDAIIINQGFYTLLQGSDTYANLAQETRILMEHTINKKVEQIVPNVAITKEPSWFIAAVLMPATPTSMSTASAT